MHRPTAVSLSPEILLLHADFVRRIARGLLGDAAAAEDVVQDTMVAAIEQPPRQAAGLRGWLAQVGRNFARQRLRSDRRRAVREFSVGAQRGPVPSAAQVHEREALRARVVSAVLALPDAYREVVLLRYYEDRQPRAIAAALQVPVETVRTRLKRGVERLRQELEGDPQVRGELAGALLILAGGGAATKAAAPLAVAVLAVAMVAVAVFAVWPLPASTPGTDLSAQGSSRVVATGPTEVALERREVAIQSPAAAGLAGRVLQPDGSPLDHAAMVYVSGDGPAPAGVRPMSMKDASSLRRRDGSVAVQFTEKGGAFHAKLADGGRAWVEVVWAGALLPPAGGWHTAPETGIALRTQPAPTATVQVRVQAGGAEVRGFKVEAVRADGLVYPSQEAAAATLELCLHLTNNPEGDEYELRARREPLGRAATRVLLRPGQRHEVVLQLPGGAVVEGAVVDGNGAPIADAVVFFGTFELLRGDEPFKPFRPARVRDGVRTDAAGRFRLEGGGERVTVFHPDWSPVTVARADAARIALPAPGAIAGRLVDASGQPRAGVSIALDRERPVTTDQNGTFRFEQVFSGVRGLCLPDKQFIGVEVQAGQTAEVEIGRDLVDVSIRLRGVERATLFPEGIVLVGVDPVFAVLVGKVEGETLSLPTARPGRYWLISRGDPIAFLDLQAATAEVNVGAATLIVRGAPGARVTAVPAGAHELLRTIAARPSPKAIGADGSVLFQALPAGAYEVIVAGSGRVWPVRVAAPSTELRLQ